MFSRMNAKQQAAVAAAMATISEDKYYKIYTNIGGEDILVRCYDKDGPVYASPESGEIPGTFATWKFTPGTEKGDYKFTSYAFSSEITAELEVGAQITVSSKTPPVQFRLQPSHAQDIFVIRITNKDLVWTIAKDGEKRPVTLQKADGSEYQDFKIKETVPCEEIRRYD